jgi:hypothetical protein
MRAATDWAASKNDWENAAIGTSNLSEMELTLGEVVGAERDAEQSVTYADRSRDFHMRQECRCTLGDALHQTGRWLEADTCFREAELIQVQGRPTQPLLYSVRGVKYCDLLLTAPERAAWQTVIGRSRREDTPTSSAEGQGLLTSSGKLSESCRTVSERAAKTLKWEEGMPHAPVLDLALHYLTLGRAALYEVVLAVDGLPFKTQNSELKTSIDAAVAGLRRAGTTHHIPRALLTRAWLRFLSGARTGPDSAREDLDEAWEIAERGPMRLHMADIHLYRARLFHAANPYPWGTDADGNARGPKDDLAAGRKLIEQCGYWRRKEELEDAEESAKNW